MFITVGEREYELSTKLGTAMAIEKRFKLPLTQIFEKIGVAEIPELISILAIAAGKVGDADFSAGLSENWDYMDLQTTVQEMLARLMFSGTPEQVEAKLAKFPIPEQQKNVIRGLLGLPKAEIPAAPDVPNAG